LKLEDILGAGELERNTPSDVLLMLDGIDVTNAGGNLERGFLSLLSQAGVLLPGSLGEGLKMAAAVVVIAALCAVAGSAAQGNGAEPGGSMPQYIRLAGVLSIALVTVYGFTGIMASGREAIAQMNIYNKTLMPVLATASAAAGKPASSLFRHLGTVFASDLLITLYNSLLYPLLYIYAALVTFNAALPHDMVKRFAALIKKTVTWILTVTLGLFIVYLTIGGAVSGNADALSIKAAQAAIGGFVPVVGGIISDASETLLLGASVIKNAVGVFGLLAVLGIALSPLVSLAVRAVCLKLSAALAGTLGGEGIADYLDDLSGLFSMLLALVAASAFLLIISIVFTILAGS
jgi:stage III sporulation protein AE